MKRRKRFLALAATAVMAVGLLAGCGGTGDDGNATSEDNNTAETKTDAPAAEGATYNWQAGNVLAADQPWDMGLQKFAELLNEYSDGRMTLTVQSGGSLGSEIEMVEAVQMGTLDFTILSTPSMSGFAESLNYFDLPYLFHSTESAWAVMDEWLGEDRMEALEAENVGFHGLGFYDNGEYMIAGNIRIEHPDDINGQRIRAHSSQLQCDTLAAMGANPLSVAWGDIYTSLQQGTIDSVSGTTLTNMYGGKFYEQTDYITMTKQHFIPAPVVMNEDLWLSLSDEDKDIVTRAFNDSIEYQREEAQKYAEDAKQIMEEAGVEFIEIDTAEFAEATKSVYDDWVGTNGIEQEMIDKILESDASK